jgi:hypothetical protein
MRRYNEVDDDEAASSFSPSLCEETTLSSSELEKGFTEFTSQMKNQQIHNEDLISNTNIQNNSNDDKNTIENVVYEEKDVREITDDGQNSLNSDSDAMLKLGTKVIHQQTNEEAMVSREPYAYENARYIDITYMNGSQINAQTRIEDVQLHPAEKWRSTADTDKILTNVSSQIGSDANSQSTNTDTTNIQSLTSQNDQNDSSQNTSVSNDTTPSLYKFRSELSDEEYEALSLAERKHVLHDTLWNRSYRQLSPTPN